MFTHPPTTINLTLMVWGRQACGQGVFSRKKVPIRSQTVHIRYGLSLQNASGAARSLTSQIYTRRSLIWKQAEQKTTGKSGCEPAMVCNPSRPGRKQSTAMLARVCTSIVLSAHLLRISYYLAYDYVDTNFRISRLFVVLMLQANSPECSIARQLYSPTAGSSSSNLIGIICLFPSNLPNC